MANSDKALYDAMFANIRDKAATAPQTNKRFLYRTAQARISCARVREGEYVSVRYEGIMDGTHWYAVTATEQGEISPVMYTEEQLAYFCL